MKIPNYKPQDSNSSEGVFVDALQKWIRGNGGTIYGTAAQRTTPTTRGYVDPANVADGTFYVETDGGLYQMRDGTWVSLDIVLGAANLTNAGAIPKVSATDGTLDESAMTDNGTNIIALLRSIGINVAPIVTTAGRRYVTVKGDTLAGVVEMATAQADADDNLVGLIQATDVNNLDAERRVALIQMLLDGATGNHRGGTIRLATKADSGVMTVWVYLDQAGSCGFGGNAAPAYAVDATGQINASTGYRVGGTAGVTGALALTLSTSTIQYKDWGGANQSISVVTNVTLTSNAFTGGIRTT